MEWISVSDRLPDNGEEVIVAVTSDFGGTPRHQVEANHRYIAGVDGWERYEFNAFKETMQWFPLDDPNYTITHWMPMPDPPQPTA